MDRAKAIAVYGAHLEEVRRSVPAERLLVFNVNEGWAPLCAFLGQPVPAHVKFPHRNERVFFRRVILALRLATWLVPALVVAGLVWVGVVALSSFASAQSLTCGIQPIPNVGCRIGRCVDGAWEQVCD